jgi:hypothetical protein
VGPEEVGVVAGEGGPEVEVLELREVQEGWCLLWWLVGWSVTQFVVGFRGRRQWCMYIQ